MNIVLFSFVTDNSMQNWVKKTIYNNLSSLKPSMIAKTGIIMAIPTTI